MNMIPLGVHLEDVEIHPERIHLTDTEKKFVELLASLEEGKQ